MNIIHQQREHILENNNIGKTELRDVLVNTNKRIETIFKNLISYLLFVYYLLDVKSVTDFHF